MVELLASGTSKTPASRGPVGIAFDGTHMWVTNSGSNNVTEL
jgi:DNA-binding beta-propeller fold protein YncE